MKTTPFALSLLIALSVPSFARIGEDSKQCDARYGDALSRNTDGDLESRSYNFSGKQIQVVFYKSKSVMELLVSGPQPILGADQAKQFTTDHILFFKGLLASAYAFTDDQVLGLIPFKRTGRGELTSGTIANGALHALFWLTTTEDEDRITFSGLVWRPPEGIEMKKIAEFQVESAKVQAKESEKNQANGF